MEISGINEHMSCFVSLPKVDYLVQFGGVWLRGLVFAAPGYKSMVNWTAIIIIFSFQKMVFLEPTFLQFFILSKTPF
jgi:hypothetical protein